VNVPVYYKGADLPDLAWWHQDSSGTLVDFSAGYTFSVKVASASTPTTASFTKSTGITGAAGAGTEPDGTPNLVIAWAATVELNSLSAGAYIVEFTAVRTSDSKERKGQRTILIADSIT
jgi:hypothetical protein